MKVALVPVVVRPGLVVLHTHDEYRQLMGLPRPPIASEEKQMTTIPDEIVQIAAEAISGILDTEPVSLGKLQAARQALTAAAEAGWRPTTEEEAA